MAKPISVPKTMIRRVRDRLRDSHHLNELIDFQEESSDVQIARELINTLQEWNLLPVFLPGVVARFENFVDEDGDLRLEGREAQIAVLIVEGTVARVLESVSISMMRNELEYTSGNVSVKIKDKWRSYFGTIIPALRGRFEQGRDMVKGQQNMEAAWGASHTELLTGLIRGDNEFTLPL